MATFAGILAGLLYLLPIVAFAALRSTKDRELWEVGLDLPLALALDLLLIHLLARFVIVDTAALASRGVWLVAGAVVVVQRRRADRPLFERPTALTRSAIASTSVASALALLLSLSLSRPYAIWDRRWHIPLVASLRGQTIPFTNVFEAQSKLAYHFAGNTFAAALQSLSFGVIHSSHGLSLAHDLVFLLFGATLVLFLISVAKAGPWTSVLAVLGTLLAGPLTLFRLDRSILHGYSFVNWLCLSFRPHVSLAGFLYLGVLGPMIVRLAPRDEPYALKRTLPPLLASAALLAITDEGSLGLLGLAIGITWLIQPNILHPKRALGVAILVGLAVALVVPNVLFSGALAPGAPKHVLAFVPFRSPGYHNPPLAFSAPRGLYWALYDLAPVLLTLVGGLLTFLKNRGRERGVTLAFFAALSVISIVLLTTVEVDHEPKECHRFITAAFFLAPFFGAYWIALSIRDGNGPSVERVAAAILASAAIFPGAASLDWALSAAPKDAHHFDIFNAPDNHYSIDCRAQYAAKLGERPQQEYLSKSIAYLWAGCHPVYMPGVRVAKQWELKTEPAVGEAAMAELEHQIPANQPLILECPVDQTQLESDPICRFAIGRELCERPGPKARRCILGPADRAARIKTTR